MSAAVKHIAKSLSAGTLAIATFVAPALLPGAAGASDFDAEKVMKEMDGVQRYAYVAGVVEGLAVARYMKDGKNLEGMSCIYGWFYEDRTTKDTIYAAFERYGSYKPGAVIDVLAKQKCGE